MWCEPALSKRQAEGCPSLESNLGSSLEKSKRNAQEVPGIYGPGQKTQSRHHPLRTFQMKLPQRLKRVFPSQTTSRKELV